VERERERGGAEEEEEGIPQNRLRSVPNTQWLAVIDGCNYGDEKASFLVLGELFGVL